MRCDGSSRFVCEAVEWEMFACPGLTLRRHAEQPVAVVILYTLYLLPSHPLTRNDCIYGPSGGFHVCGQMGKLPAPAKWNMAMGTDTYSKPQCWGVSLHRTDNGVLHVGWFSVWFPFK